MYALLVLTVACWNRLDKTPDGVDDSDPTVSDDSGDSTPDSPVDDTGEPAEELEPTPGPDLPDCTPQTGTGSLFSLSGVVLTPSGPVAGVVVFDQSTEKIVCVGDCDDSEATRLCTEGVISPGLVDGHNHMQYNSLPPWQVEPRYSDRYDWRSDDAYYDYRTAYDAIEDDKGCEISRWAELRDLASGATSAVGTYGASCIRGLVRNLDEDSNASGISDYELYYSARTVTDLDESDADNYSSGLSSGKYECVLDHVAEGTGGAVTDEAQHMLDIGMVGPGFAWVHAADATVGHLAYMASHRVGLMWAPQSNLALYGATAQAPVAMRLGVPLALGPDWTPSGSISPKQEAACADTYLRAIGQPIKDSAIFELITSAPASVLGLEGQIGELSEGAYADIAVYRWSSTPYRAVIDAEPQDVLLTVISGEAVYGLSALVTPLASASGGCEPFDACGEERLICATAGDSPTGSQTYSSLEEELSAALAKVQMPQGLEYAGQLFPIIVCADDTEYQRDPCVPDMFPSATDADGDGLDDSVDVCPRSFDPDQGDHDGDGVGDTCDACPLMPGESGCRHQPEDIDDDGITFVDDVCPVDYDPTNGDGDGDGLGDACDPCPEEDNSGGGGCSVSVEVLQDESHPDHPPDGTEVTVCDLVVTGIATGKGFFAQDPSLTENAGIYVFLNKTFSVSVGDEVCVSGTYTEYYDLAEIAYGSFTVVTAGAGELSPLEVEPCDVGNDSASSEALESMLVTVRSSDGVVVSSSNPDGSSDYGTFEVNSCLYVDDVLATDYERHPAEGTVYESITGPMTWSFDHRRILPRSAADIVAGSGR